MQSFELYKGDCLDILPEIPTASVNCIICDLPYGTTACKWDCVIPMDKLWEQYERIIKPNGVIVLFGQEPFSSIVRTSNLKLYRYDWVWRKQKPSNFQLMGYQPGRIHENIMIFSKSNSCFTRNGTSMIYYAQTTPREKARTSNVKIYGDDEKNILHKYKRGRVDNYKTYTDKQPVSILEFNTVTKNKMHPTQKPVELLEYLIKTYTQKGDIVLDNCMGSGSTGVACINLGRYFIGIEKNEEYFNRAKERIEQHK